MTFFKRTQVKLHLDILIIKMYVGSNTKEI